MSRATRALVLAAGAAVAAVAAVDADAADPQSRAALAAPAAPLPPGAVGRLGTLRFRHGEGVETLLYAPDGKILVSVSWYRKEGICIWDAATGRLCQRLSGKSYQGAAISPDGKDLAVACWSEVLVYDLAGGREKLQFPVDAGTELVAWSPDGKTLAAWCIDTEQALPAPRSGKTVVTLHNAGTGKLVRRLERQHDPAVVGNTLRQQPPDSSMIKFVSFALDGRVVLAAGWERVVYAWDARTGAKLTTLGEVRQPAYRFAVSADGRTLAAVGCDGRVRLHEIATGQEIGQTPVTGGKDTRIPALAFAPGGKVLATAGMVGEGDEWLYHVDLWDVPGGRHVGQVPSCIASALAFSPDGATLATHGGALQLWDVKTGRQRGRDGGHVGDVIGLAFMPDGRTLISQGRDRTIRWWDLKSGKETRRTACFPTTPAGCMVLSPDGRVLAYGRGYPGDVALLDAATGRELRRLPGHKYEVGALAFAADGKSLLTSSQDGIVTTWEVGTGRKVRDLRVSNVTMFPAVGLMGTAAVAQSDPGKRCAYELHEIATGKVVHTLSLAAAPGLGPVALTPDRKRVIVGNDKGEVSVVEVATGKERLHFHASGFVNWLIAVSPDGKTLAVGPYPMTSREIGLWDLDTGKCLARFPTNGYQASALAFSPDGRLLAAGGPDTTITLWDVSRLRR
jgi:WD40 repeat protein